MNMSDHLYTNICAVTNILATDCIINMVMTKKLKITKSDWTIMETNNFVKTITSCNNNFLCRNTFIGNNDKTTFIKMY